MTIKLDSIDKVKEFVDIAGRYDGDITVSSKNHAANGKSIMGILSLDLKEKLTLEIGREENMSALIGELEPYLAR